MDRTSLEITIFILTVLSIRGIFVLANRASRRKKGGNPDPTDETLQPTEEVVFFLALLLLAVSIWIWRLGK